MGPVVERGLIPSCRSGDKPTPSPAILQDWPIHGDLAILRNWPILWNWPGITAPRSPPRRRRLYRQRLYRQRLQGHGSSLAASGSVARLRGLRAVSGTVSSTGIRMFSRRTTSLSVSPGSSRASSSRSIRTD